MLALDELTSLLPDDHPLPMLEVYLDDEHSPAPVFSSDQPPFRLRNVKGQDRKVLPTIVSYPLSHAFERRKDGRPGPGQLFNNVTQKWESPSLREKEILLGYDVGHTDGGPSVSAADRHHMLG